VFELVPVFVEVEFLEYRDHVVEMGGKGAPAEPVIFTKPPSAITQSPKEIVVPAGHGLLHHEVELCVILGGSGKRFSPQEAEPLIAGWAVGLDLTLRERQLAAKKKGRPWALAKGFDHSCVLGGFVPAGRLNGSSDFRLSLSVNGKLRQNGSTADMVFRPEAILSFISKFMTLEIGDVLMCGTPAGVAALEDGDRVQASITGLPKLDFLVRRD